MSRDTLAKNLHENFKRYRGDIDSIQAEVGEEEKVEKYKDYYERLKEDYPDLFERTVPSDKPDQPPIPELVARIIKDPQSDSLKLDFRSLTPEEQKDEYEIILRQAIDKTKFLWYSLKIYKLMYKLKSDNNKLREENKRLKNDLLQQNKDLESSKQKEIESLTKEKNDKINRLEQEIDDKKEAIKQLRKAMSDGMAELGNDLFDLQSSQEEIEKERSKLTEEKMKLQKQIDDLSLENGAKDSEIKSLHKQNKQLTDEVRMLREGDEILELRRQLADQLIEGDTEYKELDPQEKQKMKEIIIKGMSNVQKFKIEAKKYEHADKNTTAEFKGITPEKLDDGSLEVKTEIGSAFYFKIDINEKFITTTSSLKPVLNDPHLSDARVFAWYYTLEQAGKTTEDIKPSKLIGKDVLHGSTNDIMKLFIRGTSKTFEKGSALYYAFMATTPGKANMFSLTQHPNKMGKRDIVRGSIEWTKVEWAKDKVLQITCELQ